MAKKKSIWAIIGGIVGLLAIIGASIGIAMWVKQSKCEHIFDDGEVKVEATCSEEGEIVFKCEECGKRETEKVEKLAHTWKFVEVKAPTCTENGLTEYTICEVCEEYKNDVKPQTLLATGHQEVELEAVAPTCTETGLTAGKKCLTCDEVTVEQKTVAAKGHTLVALEAVASTCTETGLTAGQKCSACETVYIAQTEVPATGHTYEDGYCVCGAADHAYVETVGYTETDVAVGETVAGSWYRFYLSETVDTTTSIDMDIHFTVNETSWRIGGWVNVHLNSENPMIVVNCMTAESAFTGTALKDIYYGEGYIDFYVPVGLSVTQRKITGPDTYTDYTMTFDESIVVTSMCVPEGASIKRLVLNAAE